MGVGVGVGEWIGVWYECVGVGVCVYTVVMFDTKPD